MLEINKIYNMDCIEALKLMDNNSVDMFFVDLPYGVTAKNEWDNIIPIEPMWEQVLRVAKETAAILFFGQDKFTAKMMLSQPTIHRYNIIWDMVLPTGFLNVNRQPLREHEDIMVFYKSQCTYNPQRFKGEKTHSKGKAINSIIDDIHNNNNYGNFKIIENINDMKYPTSIWQFPKPHPSVAIHPTEKPIELCRYAIRTYSNENDLVVDFCCGSGSIPKSAQLEHRNYIGIDNGICDRKGQFYNWNWADVAKFRLDSGVNKKLF